MDFIPKNYKPKVPAAAQQRPSKSTRKKPMGFEEQIRKGIIKKDTFEKYISKQILSYANSTIGKQHILEEIKDQTGQDFYYFEMTTDENSNKDDKNFKLTTDVKEYMISALNSIADMLMQQVPIRKYHWFFMDENGRVSMEKGTRPRDAIFQKSDIKTVADYKPDKDGRYHAFVSFNPAALERESFAHQRDAGAENLHNIVRLYQTGYHAKHYIYGTWGLKVASSHMSRETSPGSGVFEHVGSDSQWASSAYSHVRSRKKLDIENGYDFMSEVVHMFNVYNRERTGAYARLVGEYTVGQKAPVDWEDIIATYWAYNKDESREWNSQNRREIIITFTFEGKKVGMRALHPKTH